MMNMARKLEERKYWNCMNVLVRVSWLSLIKRTNHVASTTCCSFTASSAPLRTSKPPTHVRRRKLREVKHTILCWSWTHSKTHLAPEPHSVPLCLVVSGGGRR